MRFVRPVTALMFVTALAVMASAQGYGRHRGGNPVTTPPNPQALLAMQQDLIAAIGSMKAALPIYDGNRVRSINAAHTALLIVDRAISGARAVVRTKPNISDNVHSKDAKSKFSVARIQSSQTDMRQGLVSLQTAWKDLQAAAGSNPNKQAINASNHLQKAINEATTAITLHAAQG